MTISLAIIIAGLKIYGWIATGSSSLMASLIDSCLDISSSIINLVAVSFALAPPDHKHRFGHEKIQDLALFAQASFFIGSGFFSVFNALRSNIGQEYVSNHDIGMKITILSSILTAIIVAYQSFVIRKTHSPLVQADKLHYITDILTNAAVFASFYISAYWPHADLCFAVLINIYIIYIAYQLLVQAVKNLIDQEASDEEKQVILGIIRMHPQVQGVHELKTRHASNKLFIQCHLELDGRMPLLTAYHISEEITASLEEAFPDSEIIIHQDPAGVEHQINYPEDLGHVR